MLGYIVIAIGAYLLFEEMAGKTQNKKELKHETVSNDGLSGYGDNGGSKPGPADQSDCGIKAKGEVVRDEQTPQGSADNSDNDGVDQPVRPASPDGESATKDPES